MNLSRSKPSMALDGKHRIFVAYPYSFDQHSYRSKFKSVERKLKNITFVFADEAISSETVLEKITKMISEAEFGIYDITTWNPNVALEYGLSRGMRKKAVIAFNPAINKGEHVPSDLAGYDRIQYNNHEELENGLIRTVSTMIPVGNQSVRDRANDVESSILIDLLRAPTPKSRAQIAEDLGVNPEVAFVFLQRLQKRGEVEVVGAKRGAKWKATKTSQQITKASGSLKPAVKPKSSSRQALQKKASPKK